MKTYLLMAGMLAMTSAEAASCPRFNTHGPMRDVKGTVASVDRNEWGVSYVLVTDQETGCRVFAKVRESDGCKLGAEFRGTGHLRNEKAPRFDATFHDHLTEGKLCR
ncbi:hypothetical protein FHS83_002082 [Rhizomicrobium palustre]|uniref:Lipoprotein n=1 Tax=Rhizomicrobium palustre TaxID=189966 RepID=A0A846MYQ0_9PROT|nr:hypothetical protein [Rhizomicrobium palustre]NIK88764.1 hypothetical protein [Rhizomicrobium palustre]